MRKMTFGKGKHLSRRKFIVGSAAAAAGGIALGLNVPFAELTVSKGVISHAASKRKISYGKVAAAASKVTPPDVKSIKLKHPKDWTIAGKPLKRLDTADKLNGAKIYAIDLKLPDMLCA